MQFGFEILFVFWEWPIMMYCDNNTTVYFSNNLIKKIRDWRMLI